MYLMKSRFVHKGRADHHLQKKNSETQCITYILRNYLRGIYT